MQSVAISVVVAIIAAVFIILFSDKAQASPTDNGWKVYRTFEYNIILWEKETRENFTKYAVANDTKITMCVMPYVRGNGRTRSGLEMVNLLKPGSFHELGFVTYTTGSKPGSASWVVTLILIENQCSLPSADPQPTTVPFGPLD